MQPRQVVEGVSWVGAVDWDRRLFDELIPLPEGTSYNAYLVRGAERTALIDAVDPPFTATLLARLAAAGVERLDYVVSNHAEQDHSGAIPAVLAAHPEARVLCTERARGMLGDLLGVPAERLQAVADGESVELGGLSLQFLHFPWVHWPETMLTWLPERRVLFPCDLFGSHLASGDLFASDEGAVLAAARRYYAEIMMPFRAMIERNLGKVHGLDPALIAPSHGPIYARPKLILDAYDDWVAGPPRNLALIPYVSMHESTRLMVLHLTDALLARGVRAEPINVVDVDLGKLAGLLVDAATVVLGSPVVLGGAHPAIAQTAFLANLLKPKARWLGVVGSLGWGGKLVEQLAALIPALKVDVLPPVLCKGVPRAADLAALDALAESIAERHRGL